MSFWKDAAERVLTSFVEGTLAGLVVTSVTDTSMWLAAASGGLTAAVATLKAVLATRVGNSDSASLTKTV